MITLCIWSSFRQSLRWKRITGGNGNAKIVYEKYCCIVPWDTMHAAKHKRDPIFLPVNVIIQSVLF